MRLSLSAFVTGFATLGLEIAGHKEPPMKTRPSVIAAAFGAAVVLAVPAPAIQNAEDVSAGERFRRPNVSIDTETRLPGGGMLAKGLPADVEIETSGRERSRRRSSRAARARARRTASSSSTAAPPGARARARTGRAR